MVTFVIDRVFIDDGEALDSMQIFAQIWNFARIRHAAIEIGSVDDEHISFPVPDRVAHEQPDVLAKMFLSAQIDNTARVVVVV